MINSLSFGQNPYGNVQNIGLSKDGRVLYRVIDSKGQEAGKLSLPQDESDTFEKAYCDIMDIAPKIQKYVSENSSETDIKRRKNISRAIVSVAGITGLAAALLSTKTLSAVKRILTTVVGTIVGLSVGFVASMAATSPPGAYRFAKANRTFARLDIKPEV